MLSGSNNVNAVVLQLFPFFLEFHFRWWIGKANVEFRLQLLKASCDQSFRWRSPSLRERECKNAKNFVKNDKLGSSYSFRRNEKILHSPPLGSKVKCDSKTVSFLVKSLTDKKWPTPTSSLKKICQLETSKLRNIFKIYEKEKPPWVL